MTAPCERFAREGALALERGELDEGHLAGCADCRAARDEHLAVARVVTAARDAWHPPAGWEARLDRTLASRAAARRRRRIWLGAAAAAAVAATIAIAVAIPGEPAPLGTPTLAMTVHRGPGARRAGSPQVGDLLQLHATAGGGRHAELRVYRAGSGLVRRCAPSSGGTPACRRDGDRLEAELALPSIGNYRIVLVTGARRAPEPQGSFDADTAAARRQGARIVFSEPLDVL